MAWAIRLPVGIDLASFIGLRAFVVPSTGDGVVFQLLMTVAIKLSAVGCHQKIASGRFYYRNKDHIDTTSQNQATCMFMPFTRSSTSLCIPVSAGECWCYLSAWFSFAHLPWNCKQSLHIVQHSNLIS
jgi:hypothetical protein